MKKILSIISLLCIISIAHAANLISEDFKSLTGEYSGTVTLPSGDWTMNAMKVGKKNSSNVLLFNTNGAYIISPSVDKPGSLTINFGSGGSKEFDIAYSIDGATWTTIDTYKISGSGTYSYSKGTNLSETSNVRFKITATKGGNVWITSFSVTGASSSGSGDETEPTNPDPQPEIPWTGPHSVEHCIYVASWATDDSGDGSWEHPYYNLQKAVDQAQPGDTIYVRGGTYYPNMTKQKTTNGVPKTTTMVELTKSGSKEAQFTIKTFPGEFPVLNFKDQPKGTNSTIYRGILITGDYWNISGLHITQAGDNGIKIEGSHNVIKSCTFSYNDDTGLQIGFTHTTTNDGSLCAYNDIIDCDSYQNADSDNGGADADGFACKMYAGVGNRFIRCRAWNNSDDGWDFYETPYTILMYECWSWGAGRKVDHPNISGFQGNGNGIKLGGNSSVGIHEAWNCVTFNNKEHGFDENHNKGGVKLFNCLAFDCGTYDYFFEECNNASNFQFFNNISFGKVNLECGPSNYTASNNVCSNASTKMGWGANIVSGYSKDDFVSLTEEDAKAPRAADGSLPTRFAHLKSTSVFIDKGVNKSLPAEVIEEFPFLEQPIYGSARDLGPYEYAPVQPTGTQLILTNSKELSLTVAYGNLQFTVPADGKAIIGLYTPQGIQVAEVANLLVTAGGQYSIPVNTQLKKGVYVARLTFNGATRAIKFTVE